MSVFNVDTFILYPHSEGKLATVIEFIADIVLTNCNYIRSYYVLHMSCHAAGTVYYDHNFTYC